jgi:hypothetical protein
VYVYRCPKCPIGQPSVAMAVREVPCCLAHASPEPMALVADHEAITLPLEPNIRALLGPLKVDTLKSAGILMPATQHALEWLYRHRATNGMAGAFCKVGGRRCIDLVAFARLMREKR